VANKDDLIEMVEATKSIASIKVAVVETIKGPKARGWIHHRSAVHRYSGNRTWRESAAHSHPWHRISLTPYLPHGSRSCENACCATKENDFAPVHSIIDSQRLKPPRFQSCGHVNKYGS
jgi:hypothetical protein